MTDYSTLYTAFISCSPRVCDAKEVGLSQIRNCINSIRNELGFKNVQNLEGGYRGWKEFSD